MSRERKKIRGLEAVSAVFARKAGWRGNEERRISGESKAGDARGNLLRKQHFYRPVLCGLWGEVRRGDDLEFSPLPMAGVI